MLLLNFVTHTCQVLLWHPGMVAETHIFGKTSGKTPPWNGGISPERECPAFFIFCPWKRPQRKKFSKDGDCGRVSSSSSQENGLQGICNLTCCYVRAPFTPHPDTARRTGGLMAAFIVEENKVIKSERVSPFPQRYRSNYRTANLRGAFVSTQWREERKLRGGKEEELREESSGSRRCYL